MLITLNCLFKYKWNHDIEFKEMNFISRCCKVKGDGVSVILSSCPNISSLGYLVFAAAGTVGCFGEQRDKKNALLIFNEYNLCFLLYKSLVIFQRKCILSASLIILIPIIFVRFKTSVWL